MILYFSGTGNSRYVARKIRDGTDYDILSMNKLMKKGSSRVLVSDEPFVFVTPTHGWRIPKVVEIFIREMSFIGNKQVYFVMTCGDGTGNAAHYLKKLCDVPDKAMACKIINKAEPKIQDIVESIKKKEHFAEENISATGWFQSAVINPVFRSIIISDRGFYTTDLCVNCGKCVNLCPTDNVSLMDGKPIWGGNCTHCMACICGCPKEAIEYRNKSKGKPRHYIV